MIFYSGSAIDVYPRSQANQSPSVSHLEKVKAAQMYGNHGC